MHWLRTLLSQTSPLPPLFFKAPALFHPNLVFPLGPHNYRRDATFWVSCFCQCVRACLCVFLCYFSILSNNLSCVCVRLCVCAWQRLTGLYRLTSRPAACDAVCKNSLGQISAWVLFNAHDLTTDALGKKYVGFHPHLFHYNSLFPICIYFGLNELGVGETHPLILHAAELNLLDL